MEKTYFISQKLTSILAILSFCVLVGCKKEDVTYSENVPGYLTKYMNYPSNVYPQRISEVNYININVGTLSVKNDTILMEYKNNRISKRISSVIKIIPPYSPIFTKQIYDTLIYTNNQISILTKSNSKEISGVTNYKKDVFFENNRIVKTIQYYQYINEKNDVVYYTYKGNLLVKRLGYKGENLAFQSDYYYNAKNNLDSIVSRFSEYNASNEKLEIDSKSIRRIKETFENYDEHINPLKSLIIFDDSFNRSLSANNYQKYSYLNFNGKGDLLNEWHYTYDLKYDAQSVNFMQK